MATYRDAALAAYAAREQAEADKAAAERDALIAAARDKTRPVLTDSTGKVLHDPLKLTVDHVDESNGLVVLSTADGSGVSFGVVDDAVKVVSQVDGRWTDGPAVADLDDVGAVLAGDV